MESVISLFNQYASIVKVGVVVVCTVFVGRLFYAIIVFLLKKYFTDKDDNIKELFESRNAMEKDILKLQKNQKYLHKALKEIQFEHKRNH